MGYVIKEVKPGVFELVFEAEAAVPAKAVKEEEEEEEEKEKEEEKKEQKEEIHKPKKEAEEEEPLPVVDAGVLKSSALSRLVRDLKEIQEFPLPTVNAAPLENNMFEWHANVAASSDTLFAGLVFHLVMTFPENYPVSPPKVRMMNYITHPNVFGEFICLDMLEDGMWEAAEYRNKPYTGWTTAYSVQSILVQLQAFFSMEAYDDSWTESFGLKRAQDSIDKFVCPCGHKKDHIWPPISEAAIKHIQEQREALLSKTGPKKPKVEPAAKKEAEAEKKDPTEKKEEPAKKDDEKAKEEKPKVASPAAKPATPKVQPLVTQSGFLPLRRYLPDMGLNLPTAGKRLGFGDKTTIELKWQRAKLHKRYRDSEIELKASSDGFVYELPINEPPPRSESKDIIYFWGEVYPLDEVDTSDADPSVAARRAAGIPLVKELTVGELLKARPLNIPKQDTLTITLNDAGGIDPFRQRISHTFKTVYDLDHYSNVKFNDWKLFAFEEKNPQNYLVLNLKSNKFNLHFLSSIQYFVHVEKKPQPKKEEQEKGKKGANDKGKKQPAKGQAQSKDAGKPAGKAAAKEEPKSTETKADAGKGAPRQAKGKAPQAKGQEEQEAPAKGKHSHEEEVPVKKYVPPPSTPLFISNNFGAAAPPVSAAQRRRDRKGKDKVDAPTNRRGGAAGRGRATQTAPVGTGKGKEKEGTTVVLEGKVPEEKATETPAAEASTEKVPAKEGDAKVEGAQNGADAKGQRGNNRRNRNRGKGEQGKTDTSNQGADGAVPAAKAAPKGGNEATAEPKKGGAQKPQGEKKRRGFNIYGLPAEIRSHIFSFLQTKDLFVASKVSHEFEALSRGILAKSELFCYHTKLTFQEDTLGIGVSYKYYPASKNIESISSQLDLLSSTAFHVDKVRKSVWKVRFHDWIPLYISYKHGLKAVPLCEQSISRIITGSPVGFEPKMAITVFTKLMNTMIVDLMKGQSWASEKALEGYFAFHHWLLVFLERYPSLVDWVNETIGNFIHEERYRTKRVVPALGEFIPLLALTDKYHWKDVAEAYLLENFDRNQKWVLQKYPALGNLANEREPVDKTRIIKTQDATVVSQRLLMFHVFFLNHIAKPKGMTVADMKRMYDDSYGRPSDRMKYALQQRVKELQKISNWIEFFNLVEMPLPTPRVLTSWLRASVNNSARKRYHNRNDYAGKTRQKKKKDKDEQEAVDPYDDF